MCLSFCPIGLKMWCSDGKDYHEILISSSFSNNIHHLDRKRKEQKTKLSQLTKFAILSETQRSKIMILYKFIKNHLQQIIHIHIKYDEY